MPPKKRGVTEVSDRLLQPTASRSAQIAPSAYTPTPRQNLHSSQRKRDQSNFIRQVVADVAVPVMHEQQRIAIASAVSNDDNNETAALAPVDVTQEQQEHQQQQQQEHTTTVAGNSVFRRLSNAPIHNTSRRSVHFPVMPESLTVARKSTTTARSGVLPSATAKRAEARAQVAADASVVDNSAAETKADESKPSAAAAVVAPPAPPPPRFQTGTRQPHRYRRSDEPDENDEEAKTAETFVVSVPSPWTRGWISKRIRSSARAINVNAADTFHRAEQQAENARRDLLGDDPYDERKLLIVRRFDNLDDIQNASLLDINMDGNAKCISARRPGGKTVVPGGASTACRVLGPLAGVGSTVSVHGAVGAGAMSLSAREGLAPAAPEHGRYNDFARRDDYNNNGNDNNNGTTSAATLLEQDNSPAARRKRRAEERKRKFDNFFALFEDSPDGSNSRGPYDPRQARLTEQLNALLHSARTTTCQTRALSATIEERRRKLAAGEELNDESVNDNDEHDQSLAAARFVQPKKLRSPYHLPPM